MKRTDIAYKKIRTESSDEDKKQVGNINNATNNSITRIRFPHASEQYNLLTRLARTEEKLEKKLAPIRQDKKITCSIIFVVGIFFMAYLLYVFYSVKSDNISQMKKIKDTSPHCDFDEYCQDANLYNNATSILNCSSNIISDYCKLGKGLSSLNMLFNLLLIVPAVFVVAALGACLVKNKCLPKRQIVSAADFEGEAEGLLCDVELANLPIVNAIEIIQKQKITLDEKIKYRSEFFKLVKDIPALGDKNISSIVLQYLDVIPVEDKVKFKNR